MSTNSNAVEAMKRDGKFNRDAKKIRHANYTKARGLFGRMKDLIGKVLTVDEDWIFKSKDWPYLWGKK